MTQLVKATLCEIAADARVNKAMLYYHFGSKRKLYAAVLDDMFGAVAERVAPIPAMRTTPEQKIAAFIEAIAAAGEARPHFPAIWLREIAERDGLSDHLLMLEEGVPVVL